MGNSRSSLPKCGGWGWGSKAEKLVTPRERSVSITVLRRQEALVDPGPVQTACQLNQNDSHAEAGLPYLPLQCLPHHPKFLLSANAETQQFSQEGMAIDHYLQIKGNILLS